MISQSPIANMRHYNELFLKQLMQGAGGGAHSAFHQFVKRAQNSPNSAVLRIAPPKSSRINVLA